MRKKLAGFVPTLFAFPADSFFEVPPGLSGPGQRFLGHEQNPRVFSRAIERRHRAFELRGGEGQKRAVKLCKCENEAMLL